MTFANVAEVIAANYLFTSWSARPAAADMAGKRVHVTDVGGAGGSDWISDGTNWFPAGGRVQLAALVGSMSNPVSTITGASAADFVLPGGNPTIPAGMIVPRRSALVYEISVLRHGAAGSAQSIGRLNGSSGLYCHSMNMGASDNKYYRFNVTTLFDASRMLRTNWLAPGSSGVAAESEAGAPDYGAPIDLGFMIDSANAADAFDLLYVLAHLEMR